jgi:hypothetical protein
MARPRLLLVVGLLAALATAIGAAGFDAATAERGVTVDVDTDATADLGVRTFDRRIAGGPPTRVDIARLTNRFDRTLSLEVHVAGDAPTPPVLQDASAPDALAPGTGGPVTARVNCDRSPNGPDTEHWTISVEAAGSSVTVALERTVAVTCENGTATATATPAPATTDTT